MHIEKSAYIRKLPNGKWRVYSENGTNLGTFDSESAAKNRLQQIHFFKNKGGLESPGEIVSSRFHQPIAEFINTYGFHPESEELAKFLENEGLKGFDGLFRWAISRLLSEAEGRNGPLSKSDSPDFNIGDVVEDLTRCSSDFNWGELLGFDLNGTCRIRSVNGNIYRSVPTDRIQYKQPAEIDIESVLDDMDFGGELEISEK